jgi:hypothetical protein
VEDEPVLIMVGGSSAHVVAQRTIAVLMPVDTPGAQQAQNHVVFLENFIDELQRKVPVGK